MDDNIYYCFKDTPIGRLMRISKQNKIICARTSTKLVERLSNDGIEPDLYSIGKGMPKECTIDDLEFVDN